MYLGFFIGHRHFLNHAKVLIESIKENIKKIDIIVVIDSDMEEAYLSSEIKDYRYLVSSIDNKLPFVDKIKAGKVFEEYLEGKEFIWIDVDSFFNNGIEIEKLKDSVYINPVDKRNIGVLYNDELTILLNKIYEYLNIDVSKVNPVTTTISNEEIYPYYNIGFVVVNENKNIFTKSFEVLEDLINNKVIRDLINDNYVNAVFIHQLIFSAVIIKEYSENNIHILPEGINYPLHLISEDNQKPKIKNLISFRYDNYFNNENSDELPEELMKHKKELKMIWYY